MDFAKTNVCMDILEKFAQIKEATSVSLLDDLWKQISDCACLACVKEYSSFISRISTGQITNKEITKFKYCFPPRRQERIVALLKKIRIFNKIGSDFGLEQQINQLKTVYGDRVVIYDDSVLYTTEPVILKEVNFGRFEICFGTNLFKEALSNAEPIVKAIPLEKQAMQEYPHPHVSIENIVCLGDSLDVISSVIVSFDLIAYFEMIEAILNTYNPTSPFVDISRWKGISCKDCGSYLPEEETSTCVVCSESACSDCQWFCSNCGSSFCLDCYGNNEGYECFLCNKENYDCRKCMSEEWIKCKTCGKLYCPDCWEKRELDCCKLSK